MSKPKVPGKTAPVEKGGNKSAGVTTDAMKKFGRGIAKVKNQKGGK